MIIDQIHANLNIKINYLTIMTKKQKNNANTSKTLVVWELLVAPCFAVDNIEIMNLISRFSMPLSITTFKR